MLYRKASVTTCLFLFSLTSFSIAQECLPNTDPTLQSRVLNLDFNSSAELIPKPETVSDYYFLTLAESLELIVTENEVRFSIYEDNYNSRLDQKIKASQKDLDFLKAEAKLQWAFVYLKFGHELDAALSLREAYQIAQEVKQKFPDYMPIRKTTGMLNIIVGSVPEKFNWILNLLGMDGSVAEGLRDLQKVRNSNCFLASESDLLYALVQGYILQKPDSGLVAVKKVLGKDPDQKLALFLSSALFIKNSESENAIKSLTRLDEQKSGVLVHYSKYLAGEAFLHKAEYDQAIEAYDQFIQRYHGRNYMKDAHYKKGLCYWLKGDREEAKKQFDKARSTGRSESEADKAAERALNAKELPNILLSKARYFTDGGFYREADSVLSSIENTTLPDTHDQTEYYYRKARLAHKTGQSDVAKLFYKQTIDLAGSASWYFAPNSCLLMGYILLAENKRTEAKKYFERALTYKNHEYKNSIDAKAKSALGQLRKK